MTVKVSKVVNFRNNRPIMFEISFLDTYNFLSTSLQNLVDGLPNLKHTLQLQKDYPTLSLSTITGKGVYPYAYFDSLKRFSETQLPPKICFYNDLANTDISDEDYSRAKVAWNEFNCKTFKDYTLRYLELDVYLLADVFECFRDQCLATDGLDPVHYISMASLSMTSMLKMTKAEVDLLTDAHMHEFCERGIRGGLSFTNRHHLIANNKYVTKDFDASNDSTWLVYIDENNLYGNCLCHPLPHSSFQWLDTLLTEEEIKSWTFDDRKGYTLEVDLEYPHELQDLTLDFPLAPSHMEVKSHMLTDFMKTQWKKLHANKPFHSSKN